MPSIASRLRPHPPADPASHVGGSIPGGRPPLPPASPPISPALRCPLPTIMTPANPDNLRQYYAGGQVPQYRFPPPNPLR